ncbi:hypothetical protein VTN77DRAFT_8656 [Rasamsonia byssochlamydoides]|uniref:uncharacterized protein n=1 Tax=Rasamsonia byssochlamydoides TaxID=89139 RepID=UPI00374420FF
MSTHTHTAAGEAPDVSSLLHEFFSGLANYFADTLRNLHTAITTPKARYWIRICVIVAGYIMIRPLIELFFRKTFERKMEREDAKRKAQEAAFTEPGKKAKMSANSLRSGKVLGEVDTDEEEEINNGKGKSSGVPEWGKGARKRQKKYLKNLEREAERRAEELTEQEILELLDWSESEDEKEEKEKQKQKQ